MALPFIFAGLSTALMSDLDANFSTLGHFCVVFCNVSGTNALSLTPISNAPEVPFYFNFALFSTVVPSTNTGNTTAAVGGLGTLGVYKATTAGPALLSGGEIVGGNMILLAFSSSLGSGAGGFFLINPASAVYPITTQVTVTNVAGVTLTAAQITGSGTGMCVLTRAGATVGAFSDTTDTAVNILATLPGASVGSTFLLRIYNSTGNVETLLAGSGVTVSGTATIAAGASHEFQGVVTATGTPAVAIYG